MIRSAQQQTIDAIKLNIHKQIRSSCTSLASFPHQLLIKRTASSSCTGSGIDWDQLVITFLMIERSNLQDCISEDRPSIQSLFRLQ